MDAWTRPALLTRGRALLLLLRWGLPALLILIGFAILLVDDGSRRWDGWAMCVGAAFSLMFLTVVYGMGAKGDLEREDEEAARQYFREHGRWPDDD